jgi:uncharacterized protein (DUF3084 family)
MQGVQSAARQPASCRLPRRIHRHAGLLWRHAIGALRHGQRLTLRLLSWNQAQLGQQLISLRFTIFAAACTVAAACRAAASQAKGAAVVASVV